MAGETFLNIPCIGLGWVVWQSGSRGCGNHQSGVDNGWNAELEYFVEHLEGANVVTETFWQSFERYKDKLKSDMTLSKILHCPIFSLKILHRKSA